MNKKIVLNPKNWVRRLSILAIVILIVIGLAIFGVRQVYNNNLHPVTASQKSVTVNIPLGYSLPQITKLLKDKNLIKSEWAFKQYVRNQQASDDIKAGTYELSPSYSVQEIVSIITAGKIKTNLLTILPGQRLDQVRKTFINSGFSAAAVDSALDPALYKNHPALVDKPTEANLEGYLYPESFQKTSTTTPEQIITLSLDEIQKQLTPKLRAAIASHGLSVHQGIILASLAEQEADKPADRAQVIRVFLNRLGKSMKLESDPTAFYGAHKNGQPASLSYDSPYNTYLYGGLPIGPISNVSESSLTAVGYPAASDYLFFVAGDNGIVRYSRTVEEHQALVRQYCQKKCAPH